MLTRRLLVPLAAFALLGLLVVLMLRGIDTPELVPNNSASDVTPGYVFRVPLTAPSDWTVATTTEGFNDAEAKYINDATYFLSKVFEKSKDRRAFLLKQWKFKPLSANKNKGMSFFGEDESSINAFIEPDEKTVYLNTMNFPREAPLFFLLVVTIDHELHHALFDTSLPQTAAESADAEIRVFTEQQDSIQAIEDYVKAMSDTVPDWFKWIAIKKAIANYMRHLYVVKRELAKIRLDVAATGNELAKRGQIPKDMSPEFVMAFGFLVQFAESVDPVMEATQQLPSFLRQLRGQTAKWPKPPQTLNDLTPLDKSIQTLLKAQRDYHSLLK